MAVRRTDVPYTILVLQVAPQLIPLGVLNTAPEPEPLLDTVRS